MQDIDAGGDQGLRGMITDRHLDQAEEAFPGITDFYRQCVPSPRTFLDLVARFAWEMDQPAAAS
jgi:hypothetical protein